MMTDRELADQVWAELQLTTITYGKWKAQGFTPGHWANAKAANDRIAPLSSDVPAPPVLTNPMTFTARSGQSNFFDAAGGDCIIKSVGVVEQSANVAANNAVVTLKNYRNAIVEPLATHAANLQTGPGQNGSGYGFYALAGNTLYMEQYQPSGPAMAQGVVYGGIIRLVQLLSPNFSAMAPVWHVAKGKPAEVHTDAIQSYPGCGPGTQEIYDGKFETCGTCVQVSGLTTPMGSWKYHRVHFGQVVNPSSDEMPYMMAKSPAGSNLWPTDSLSVTYHALGTPFGVNWQGNDPAAYAPGGAWQNTGEAWVPV